MKQGLVNICRNIWFSLASTAIISACIFLFCVFFSVITNIEYMVRTAETTMGITVFFDENLTEDEIKDIGAKIESDKSGMIKEIKFVSAEEAWDGFKTEYFGEDEALAEGFADDNPLAGSSSYEIRLNNITDQDGMVAYLESIDGVRKVNYSNSAATGLASFNKILGLLFGVLIAMLLAVAVFLISNTISVAAEFRKNENRIMRLIGATNFMIRAPFVVEGTILGLVGAAIPLGVMLFVYRQTVEYVMNRFELLSGIIQFLPLALNEGIHAAVEHALELAVNETGHVAPDVSVQTHGAVLEALFPVPVEGNGGALDKGVAQHQELGQHSHDQDDGGQGATAQGIADGGDNGVGGQLADEKAGHSHDGAGSKHGGEALVERLHGGGPTVKHGLEL